MKKLLLFLSVAFGFVLVGNKVSAQTIAYPATNTYTYGQAVTLTPTITGGAATNGTLTGNPLPAGLTVAANGTITGNPTVVGTFAGITVRVRIAGGNHTSNSFTITVNPAPLTITAATNNKPYGNILTNGNITPPAFTVTGIQFGETVGSVAAVYGTGSASTAAIATYANQITISGAAGGTFTAAHYTITYVPGNIVVGLGALTITATGVSKVYGSALTGGTGFTTGFTTTGLATGETVGSVTIAYGTGSATTDPVGTDANQITVSAVTGGTFNPANYTITYVKGTITVTGAPLTLTATGPTKTYGTALTTGASATNFTASAGVLGQTVTSVTLTPNAAGLSATTAAGLPYTVTPSAPTGTGGFLASNYTITVVVYNGTVAQAPLTVTATGPLKPYGTAIATGTSAINFTYSGTVLGQTVSSVTLTPDANGASSTTPVGSPYVITPSAPTGPGLFLASNYSITFVPYNGTVTTGNLTITANVSKVYGNTLTGGTGFAGFTTTGLATGETVGSVTVAYGTGSATTDAVGSYPNQVTVSAATGGTFNPANYNITYTTGTITVTGAPLTVTATGPTKTYGTALTTGPSTINFTATAGVLGQTVTSVTLTPNAAGLSNATAAGAAYTVTPSAPTGTGGFLASNYIITYNLYNGTVAQAPLSITANTNNKPYGTTLTNGNITTFTSVGLLFGQTINHVVAAYGTGAASNAAIGTYANQITISGAAGGTFNAANYAITYNPGNIVVTTGTLNITANFTTKTYGTVLTSGPGSVAFTTTGLATGETVGSVTMTYGTGSAATDAAGFYFNQATPSAATGGTFNPANYTITYNSNSILVTQAPLTITANSVTKNFGVTLTGGAGFTTFTSTGLVNGETIGSVTLAYGTGSAANAAVGTYTNQVTPSRATGGTFNANNYTITYVKNNIIVIASVPALTYASNTYAVGATFTLTPTNGGSAVVSSTISPGLPAGITMSATGVITGSSAASGTIGPFIVTATNAVGSNPSNSFTITFVSPPVISYSPSTNVYTAGVAITPLVPTNTGGAVGTPGFGTGTTFSAALNVPQGVTIGPSGNIYVADSNNGLIRIYSPAGVSLGTFPTPGVTLGNPMGVAFDSAGNVYILDNGNRRIYKYNSTGTTLIATFNPGGLGASFGIAIDASNNLYVTSENGFIDKLNSTTGAVVTTINTGPINTPESIVTDAAGNIYFVDSNNGAVYKYNSSGVYVSTIASGFNFPLGLGIDASGNLYVGDSGTGQLFEYSSGGVLLNTLNGLNDPEGIAADANGNVYVSDATVGSLVKYPTAGGYYLTGTLPAGLSFSTTTGTFSGTPTVAFGPTTYTIVAYNAAGKSNSTTVTLSCTVIAPAFHYTPSTNVYSVGVAITPLVPIVTSGNIGAPGFGSGTLFTGATLNTPQGITTDAAGNYYVADSGNGVIRKYNSAGVYQGTFGTGLTTPMGIVFDSAGNAYVLDQGTGWVYKFNAAGVLQATLNPRGGGGFVSGFDIAIDASNNLYVSENGNGNVYKFTTAGVLSQTIALPGGSAPTQIVTDASGNFYVADNGNGAVYKYSSTGVYVSTIISGLNTPDGLAIDAGGNLYVGDSGTGTITEYNSSGTSISSITGLNDPEGLTIDSNGDVIATDATNETVTTYPKTGGYYLSGTLPSGLSFNNTTGTFSGTPTTTFGPTTYTITAYSYGLSATTTVRLSCTLSAPVITYTTPNVYCVGTAITALVPVDTGGPVSAMTFTTGTQITGVTLNGPVGMGKDASGNLYVADYNNGVIREYSSTGVYIGTFGAAGHITAPMGIVFDSSGNAYVLNVTGGGVGVVYEFSSTGTYIATLNPRGGNGFRSGTGIAIDASNNLYVTENGNGNIYKFTTAGVLSQTITVTQINAPAGIAIDASGNIYVSDSNNNDVVVLNSAGTYVSTFATGFNGPIGLSIDAAGNIYVADTGNNQVDVYSSIGALLATINTNLNAPEGLTTDASGNLYVTDNGNNRLYKYTVTGNYTISPALPAGLTFNTATGVITGTPTTVSAATVYTVGCSNATGPATTTVNITVTTTPAFTYTTPDIYTTNVAIPSPFLTPSITAGAGTPTSYSISATLPTGLSFNTSTGVISGTPAVASPLTSYIITGTNTCGVGSYTVQIQVNLSAPVVNYTTPQVYTDGIAITPLNPNNTGGPATWTIGTALPTGLIFDTTTGIISGTPSVVSPATNYLITATNAAGSASQTIMITCNPAAPVVAYTSPQVYTDGITITPLNPNNTGGVATWTIGTALPTGLIFDTTTGIISGTPTVVSPATTYLITATNVTGSASQTITITCNPAAPVVNYTTPQVYTDGTAIAPLDPNNTGGVATWTIGTALPTGLIFDTTTGIISGTPTVVSPATTYLITATNVTGSASQTITITCNPAAPVVNYTTPQVYTDGITITPLNPNNTGGVATWTIGTPLPTGLIFDTTTGIISGTPTVVSPATTYLITATNVTGSASQTITITCNPAAPVVNYTTPQVYTDGTAITPLDPNNTGGVATWTIGTALPTGLIFDTTTGIISGTPTVVSPATTYLITATNVTGSASQTITITCNPALPAISYTTPDTYNVGVLITPLTPTNTGGAVASWSISPALPAGLNFDTTTGIISGTPTVITALTAYTVTATNVTGSATFVINIAVVSDAPVIAYTSPDTYTVGTAIAPLVPTNTGGAAATWSISPGLPAGLSFDVTTGIITGNPTAVSAAANYLVTATNAGGSGTFTISIACVTAGPVLTYTTPDVFPLNIAITPLSPVNTGTTPLSTNGYSISAVLPTGLSFDVNTGIISGTPTVASAASTYTITATDGTNTGMFTVSIACVTGNDWVGTASTDWNDFHNWSAATVPASTDVANIGVNVPFTNFPTVLTGESPSVGAVLIGTTGGQAGGVAVSSGATLTVGGAITFQSEANPGVAYNTAALSGAGSITAAGINVTANTTLSTPAAYTETLTTSVSSLVLTGNVSLTSTMDASSNPLNAWFEVTGGTASVAGAIQTSNGASSTSTFKVSGGTLQLAGSAALSGLSAPGTNVVSFNNPGATIEYSGGMQTYYTDADVKNAGVTVLAGGVTYNSIKFSGTGVKSPTGTNANNLLVSGDFTNALTTNDASDYIDLSLPNVNFNGTSQNIYGGSGTGTKFYNVTISTAGTATIQSGAVAVASTGVLTMSGGSATLAAGSSLLTLNSDINGTATVAAIPAGCGITGTVNAQRYITGGAFNYRGYRLASSPVYANNDGTGNIYSINYLINTVYLKGTTGTAGGFDAAGNPNLYLFRENLAGTNATFTSGNFRGVNTLGTGITNVSYLIDIDGGPFNIPVGAGYMFYFRGDRAAASLATETTTTYVPTAATLTATGTLNQGTVTARDWYTPTSANLGFTTISGTPKIEGYNLVGNPYASSIDWDNFDASIATAGIYGPNVNSFLYIIDPVNNNYNVYQAKSGIPGTQGIPNSNVIPSGQGFFVTAANASAQLIFSESAKTNAQANAANGNLLMASRLPSGVKALQPTSIPQYLHLKMAKDSVNNDGMIISFRSNTSSNFNPAEDAPYRLGNGSVVISSMSADNVPLGINSMPLPATTGQTIIPLNVWGTVDGTYTITMDKVNAIPALFNIWLKDAYRKDSLDIRANPTYTFDVLNADTNSYGKHRFSLVMGENPALMIHLLSFGASKIPTGDQVVWTTENEQNYTNFTVERSTDGNTFNDLGGFPSNGQGTYSYLDKTPVNGANMYRLKIVDINGTVSYSNVVTIMYANTGNQIAINGMMVYPNPTAGTINLSITTNKGTTAKPAYDIEIVNNLGSVIKSAQSSSPLWQSDVTSLTPGTYFIRVIDTSNNTVVGKSAFVKL